MPSRSRKAWAATVLEPPTAAPAGAADRSARTGRSTGRPVPAASAGTPPADTRRAGTTAGRARPGRAGRERRTRWSGHGLGVGVLVHRAIAQSRVRATSRQARRAGCGIRRGCDHLIRMRSSRPPARGAGRRRAAEARTAAAGGHRHRPRGCKGLRCFEKTPDKIQTLSGVFISSLNFT